jgi:Uma2 family endonuclease
MTLTESTRTALALRYEREAQEYMESLPLEHFMEQLPHAHQRKITLESLDLVSARRPEVQVFNELLVQYPRPRQKKLGKVVPDNMVVIDPHPIAANLSFNIPLISARPFWMLEYVSKSNERKDYVENKRLYERHLKVPYYLLFDTDKETLILWRHNGKRYVAVNPNAHGRLVIEELDLEMAIHGGWVRFWYQGKLLPLPAELQKEVDAVTRERDAATARVSELEREVARLQRELQKAQPRKNSK